MKIDIEIKEVTGGYKITAQYTEEVGRPPSFDEAYASTKRGIPARIKTLLAGHFAESTP